MYVFVCVCVHLVSECVPTRPLLLPRRFWPASRSPSQLLWWRLGCKDMLLLLALAGPAGDLNNALLRHRLGCYVQDANCA